jgi:hypothetical protein
LIRKITTETGSFDMALYLESPRFDLRAAALSDVETALETIGHAVLDGLWNQPFLTRLRIFAQDNFAASPGGATHWDGTLPPALDHEFFLELERTGLPALQRHLMGGDFVVSRTERVIRRADATIPAQFSGLHRDGQLRYCSERGINSKREVTIWTPLQDCSDDGTPRLLLLRRGQNFDDVFSTRETVSDEGNTYLPIGLRPQLAATGLEAAADRVDAMFEQLYVAKDCYAPHVPFGSAVIFNHDVVHGSYRHRGMTTPRYSLDFRTVGVYRPSRANARYEGVAFNTHNVPAGLYAEGMRMVTRATMTAAILGGVIRGDINATRRFRRQINMLKQRFGINTQPRNS